MKPVEFPEQSVVIAKDQPEYVPLPAFRFRDDPAGRIVCCWKLTWKERLAVLLSGLVWQQVMTFNHALQPQLLTADKPDMDGFSKLKLTKKEKEVAIALQAFQQRHFSNATNQRKEAV
jgi:hypothetical protein